MRTASEERIRRDKRQIVRVPFLLDKNLVKALDDHAHSVKENRTRAASNLLTKALHDLAIDGLDELWKTSGAERQMEDLLARVEDLFALAQVTGQRAFSTHRLLVHWVTKAGTLQVTEEELRAEIHAAGEDAVQQILDELRERTEPPEPPELTDEAEDDDADPTAR